MKTSLVELSVVISPSARGGGRTARVDGWFVGTVSMASSSRALAVDKGSKLPAPAAPRPLIKSRREMGSVMGFAPGGSPKQIGPQRRGDTESDRERGLAFLISVSLWLTFFRS